MKLPAKILQGLAVALTGAGLSGCGIIKSTPTSHDPNVENSSTDPNATKNAPGEKVCLPDSCPACGRG